MSSDNVKEQLIQQAVAALPKAFAALLDIGKNLCKERDLLNHCKEYKDGLEADCSQIQILGMEQPVPLDDIYTEVRIIRRIKSRMYKTIEELENEARAEIEKRSLSAIRESIREKLEHSVKEESQNALITRLNKTYQETRCSLLAQQEVALKDSGFSFADEITKKEIISGLKLKRKNASYEVESCKSELKWHEESYQQSLMNLYEANQIHKFLYKWGKANGQQKNTQAAENRLVEMGKTEEYERKRKKLDDEYKRVHNELQQKYEVSVKAVKECAHLHTELVEKYEHELTKAKKKFKDDIDRIKHETSDRPLNVDEEQKIIEQFDIEVKRELGELTRRELTRKVFSDFGHGDQKNGEVMSAWDAIQSKDRSLILGPPGAGKTTFLKYIVLRYLKSQVDEPKLPIFVLLRSFSASKHAHLLDFIVDEFAACGFPDAGLFVEHVLNSKRGCILLFDGLDEISQDKQAIIVDQIVYMSRKYRHNKFVVACRTANYRSQLEGFTEFEITEFGTDQVKKFIDGWFRDNQQLAKDFMNDLKRSPGLQELTTTPLLLALLCIGYRRNQKFPYQKALVYLTSLDALLIDWDSSKQLRRESFVENFDPESKKHLLSKVACDTFCEDILFFNRSEIIDRFEKNSVSLPIPKGSGPGILSEYVQNHGLLVERAKGIFSFSHLTIQEFLAALHLSRNQPMEVLKKLIGEAWNDRRWKEVVIFLGGLLNRADTFIVCLRNHMKADLAGRRFSRLLFLKNLPDVVETYISQTKVSGDSEGWRAWFRWRIFEYRLHEVSYGTPLYEALPQIRSGEITKHIARAARLGTELRHDLIFDRPINHTVTKALEEIKGEIGKTDFAQETKPISSYLSMAEMVTETLASGARILPDLRMRILVDIGTPDVQPWNYQPASVQNKLGA